MNIIGSPTRKSNIHGTVKKVKYIIVHSSGRSKFATDANELKYLTTTENIYCYHAYVTTTGEIHQLAPWDGLMHHVGESRWESDGNLNTLSIGVSFSSTNTPDSLYTHSQVEAMKDLVRFLMKEYNVPTKYVLGHKEVSPKRKTDPMAFDMDKFRNELSEALKPEPKLAWQFGTLEIPKEGEDILIRISVKDGKIHLRGD